MDRPILPQGGRVTTAAVEQFQPHIEQESEEFTEWILDQDLSVREKVLWEFHRWMRKHTSLSSGTIVDYRKYVAEMLKEDGELQFGKTDLDSSHKQAAWNKFAEFKRSQDSSKTNGDSNV